MPKITCFKHDFNDDGNHGSEVTTRTEDDDRRTDEDDGREEEDNFGCLNSVGVIE